MKKACMALLIVPALTSLLLADIRFARIFGHDMVLQSDKPAKIWGWAEKGERITVLFGKQLQTATAGREGRWFVTLPPMEACAEPQELTVKGARDTLTLERVLVGEVWLCGGQSNMEWSVGADADWDLEGPCADYPLVRYCAIPARSSPGRLEDLGAAPGWTALVKDNKNLDRTSGMAYYFAVLLHRYLQVPVGIVHNAWGGTTAEAWTSRGTLESLPRLNALLDHWDRQIADWPEEKARLLAEYEAKKKKAEQEGKSPPRPPRVGSGPSESRNNPGGCYNALLAPLAGLALRGVLFFQGENNAIGHWGTYQYSFPKMIEDWRAAFDDEALPFGIVSLAGFGPHANDREPEDEFLPGGFYYAAIRDVHFRTFRSTPHTGLIVTFDLGDTDYIHPHRKRGMAERAARWALAKVYDKPVVHTGPIYREMKRDGNRIKLFFDLDPLSDPGGAWWLSCPITRTGGYRGFDIAGEDRHFNPAQVRRNEKERCLEVWNDQVPEPAAVRYGWSNFPDGNVIGIMHVPAHPFRTDDWPLVEQPPYDREKRKEWDAQIRGLRKEAEKKKYQRKLEEARRLIREAEKKLESK